MPRHPDAYVRAAKPSELPTVADVLTRAFLNDPTMCYCGCAPALVADPDNPTPEDEETNPRPAHLPEHSHGTRSAPRRGQR